MGRKYNQKGFTLAEFMIVLAIISILAAVVFINVAGYLRSLAQLERDSIAKEIYVAAQNHLTMAEGQGYLGSTKYGTEEEENSEDCSIYYYIVSGGSVVTDSENGDLSDGLLSQMLPFGAIDETVRAGGSYIIRFQTEPARLLDVFYCPPSGERYAHAFSSTEYSSLVSDYTGDDNKDDRRDYSSDSSVIGWYGGEETLVSAEKLTAPDIGLINAEKLVVEVTDYNSSYEYASLQLIIRGALSGAEKAISLLSTGIDSRYSITQDVSYTGTEEEYSTGTSNLCYTVILDDVTESGLHFSELTADTTASFIPGEDIIVQAVSYSNSVLANVACSSEKTTNSLFASLEMETETISDTAEQTDTTIIQSSCAEITNFRHLENLSKAISSVDSEYLALLSVNQRSDMNWSSFLENIQIMNEESGDGDADFGICDADGNSTEAGCYYPVDIDYPLAYDGMDHRICEVQIDSNMAGNKGLFASFGSSGTDGIYSVENLALLDLCINASSRDSSVDGDAGALAGEIINTDVTNVIAYNSQDYSGGSVGKESVNIAAGSGSAGGLIGSADGGSISACAAAVYVRSDSGDAGGLVGTISGDNVSITGCYSGGHTIVNEGIYSENTDEGDSDSGNLVNVIGGGNVGGLIGNASSALITYSYSTCSAYGTESGSYVGGLVGKSEGSISNCYSTGWVSGSAESAAGTTETEEETEAESSSSSASSSFTELIEQIGAFAGSLSGSASDCCYFSIINERYSESSGFTYLSAAGGIETVSGISAFDDTAAVYQDFAEWSDESSAAAIPYDSLVTNWYGYKYSFKSVEQLGFSAESDTEDYYVGTHYGDWPIPDVQTGCTITT